MATKQQVTPHFVEKSEIVIGLVGAVGTNMNDVINHINDYLRRSPLRYEPFPIKLSRDVIERNFELSPQSAYERINLLMNAGNELRKQANDCSILVQGAMAIIKNRRRCDEASAPISSDQTAYIIDSLKHPEEVWRLRQVYGRGLYLIGVYASPSRRKTRLEESPMTSEEADHLLRRDEHEEDLYGQATRETFHLADFFVHLDSISDALRYDIYRILDVIFGNPFITPTLDEYAMFMAYAGSLRSADLSRQVGAVIMRDEELLSIGANDCPKPNGGPYWPERNAQNKIDDTPNGREYKRGYDSNQHEKEAIIQDIVQRLIEDGVCNSEQRTALTRTLQGSKLADITEYGRMVHAEMDALLSCARIGQETRGAVLFCTTFPCHNCAKHIIAAGINKVVYIEPYPKSKALEMHDDALYAGIDHHSFDSIRVWFQPFIGVGPRRFQEFFSQKSVIGVRTSRKRDDGTVIPWTPAFARIREPLIPLTYLDLEVDQARMYLDFIGRISHDHTSEGEGSGVSAVDETAIRE